MSITLVFPVGYKPVLKHGDHDQSSHGSWATGVGNFNFKEDSEKLQIAYSERYGVDNQGKTVGMTEKEVVAIKDYTLEGYKEINSMLREGSSSNELNERTDSLDRTINEAPVLFGDKNLYRVMSNNVLEQMEEGDIVTDKGYLSTTKANLTEDTFTREEIGLIADSSDTVAVILPNESKSGKGFDVGMWAQLTNNETTTIIREQEVLLPRNTPLKFIGLQDYVGNEEQVAVFQRMDK